MSSAPLPDSGPYTFAPLAIGGVEIGMPAVQAALSGYSDLPMRRVARANGAPFCINEVVLDRTVVQKGKLQRLILDVPDDDHPVGGQLMGSEPETFGRAARLMVDAGYDVIDINFGCPVPKVLGRCRGGFLLGDVATALEIIDRVVQSVAGDAPVTVKMRRGLDDSPESERSFFAILDGAFERGISGVTVHGRTVEQRYIGPSRWEFLTRVKRHLGDRVLLGSGDLFTPHDVVRMMVETGVDGVTVARGAIGNPWIFDQIRALLNGKPFRPPSLGEQRATLELHCRENFAVYGDQKGVGRARTHAIKYAAMHSEPVEVRDAFVKIRRPADFEPVFERFYPASRHAEIPERDDDLPWNAQALNGCGVPGGVAAGESATKPARE